MPKLFFTMTPGINLSKWKENGSFDREIKPYLAYADAGWEITILTFNPEKYDFSKLHKNISLINMKWTALRSFLLPLILLKHFKRTDVIKTNQSYFAWVFAAAALLAHKPLLLRCGYVYGEYLQTVNGNTVRTKLYKLLEGWAFRNAEACIVTTEALKTWIMENYKPKTEKLTVIPNFVDTNIFKPLQKVKKPYSVISVGRLHPVKRFDLLVRACAAIPHCTLTIVGEGPEKTALQNLAGQLGLPLELPGSIPNSALPEALCMHEVFAITSLREGHPKALTEALACGLPCVCAVPGQNDFKSCTLTISDTADSIYSAIAQLFDNPALRSELGAKARSFAVKRYSFEKILERETALAAMLAK